MADDNNPLESGDPGAGSENVGSTTPPPESGAAIPDTVPGTTEGTGVRIDTALPTVKPRGRPKLSDEEKARRALERATRKAASAGLPKEIVEKYAAAGAALAGHNAKVAATETGAAIQVRKAPTAEQIRKAEKALAQTFAFAGEVVYELVCKEPAPEFKERHAVSLGEAWGELLAEYLGENSAEIIRWTTALGATGYVAIQCSREIRAHNKGLPPRESEKK